MYNMIGALVAPSDGEIVVDGERVAGAPPPKVGHVFQKDTVFPWRTVERNTASPGSRTSRRRFPPRSRAPKGSSDTPTKLNLHAELLRLWGAERHAKR